MKKLSTNNGMSNEEVKAFCINHQMEHRLSDKEIMFLDFSTFIVYTAVENDEDMGFLLYSEYNEGNFNNCKYSFNGDKDCWVRLFELIGRDYDTMEKDFKSCRWEDNENTAIISFKGDSKEYAILRM